MDELLTEEEEKSDEKITFKEFLTEKRKEKLLTYIEKNNKIANILLSNDKLEKEANNVNKKKHKQNMIGVIDLLSLYNNMGNFYKKDLDILKELNKNNKNTNSNLSSKGASIMGNIF